MIFKRCTDSGLVEGKFPLTWFLTTALLSKPEMKVSSVYTWRGDNTEGVLIFLGQYMTTQVYILQIMLPSIFFNGCGSHFVLKGSIPKVNQTIKHSYRKSLPNLNASQPTVHTLSCPQAFLGGHLGKWLCMALCRPKKYISKE